MAAFLAKVSIPRWSGGLTTYVAGFAHFATLPLEIKKARASKCAGLLA
jgi:hypothetical protein